MIVQAKKIYNLTYRGRVHRIKRADLTRLNNRLATSFRTAPPAKQRHIVRIILELNLAYINMGHWNFPSDMDKEDWIGEVHRVIHQALNAYDPGKGDFMSYFSSWKHAAFSRYLDSKDTIRLPGNQRQALYNAQKKVKRNLKLTRRDHEALETCQLKTMSFSAPLEDGESTVQDMVVGEDPRAHAHHASYDDLWHKINMALKPDEFRIFRWYHHEDHALTQREIGERIGLTHEAVRLKLSKIMLKVQKALKAHAKDLED